MFHGGIVATGGRSSQENFKEFGEISLMKPNQEYGYHSKAHSRSLWPGWNHDELPSLLLICRIWRWLGDT
jgi:hypothetical protein